MKQEGLINKHLAICSLCGGKVLRDTVKEYVVCFDCKRKKANEYYIKNKKELRRKRNEYAKNRRIEKKKLALLSKKGIHPSTG